MTTPEIPKPVEQSNVPSEIKEVPDALEIPVELQRQTGATPTQTQFTQKVTDDQGQATAQTPQTATVTVQIPASPTQLQDWAKGSPDNALTWFASFWLRIVKKALHFGWQIVMGPQTQQEAVAPVAPNTKGGDK